jgi:hypothetical protein
MSENTLQELTDLVKRAEATIRRAEERVDTSWMLIRRLALLRSPQIQKIQTPDVTAALSSTSVSVLN